MPPFISTWIIEFGIAYHFIVYMHLILSCMHEKRIYCNNKRIDLYISSPGRWISQEKKKTLLNIKVFWGFLLFSIVHIPKFFEFAFWPYPCSYNFFINLQSRLNSTFSVKWYIFCTVFGLEIPQDRPALKTQGPSPF